MSTIQIGVTYVDPPRQAWLHIDVPPESTVRDAIEKSGILELFPGIDLATQQVGVFGKVTKLDAVLCPGDRVEIYRPITCDPRAVPRRDGGEEGDDGA
jgi:putative ubiquitin-RnfH superfamily antitoxin RatB of RatAB toxin-antitoxin module